MSGAGTWDAKGDDRRRIQERIFIGRTEGEHHRFQSALDLLARAALEVCYGAKRHAIKCAPLILAAVSHRTRLRLLVLHRQSMLWRLHFSLGPDSGALACKQIDSSIILPLRPGGHTFSRGLGGCGFLGCVCPGRSKRDATTRLIGAHLPDHHRTFTTIVLFPVP